MEKPIMKALIVVDMLNDFINLKGALYCGPTATYIVPNVFGRVVEYRKAGLPTFFLADNHAEDDKEFERFPKHCVKGTPGADIIDVLKFGDSERDFFIPKTRYSGFYNTSLAGNMAEVGLRPQNSVIEVCGVCTSICCMMTVADLANRDFNVVVHRNCVADFDQEAHNFALKYMKNILGATII
jgi:nicotinamidase/pyrazinamidase